MRPLRYFEDMRPETPFLERKKAFMALDEHERELIVGGLQEFCRESVCEHVNRALADRDC